MKEIILSILLLTIVIQSSAQEIKKGLSISIRTGLTYANMYGSDVESETFLNGDNRDNFYANHPASNAFKPGFNIGLLVDYRINKYFSFGLEIGRASCRERVCMFV